MFCCHFLSLHSRQFSSSGVWKKRWLPQAAGIPTEQRPAWGHGTISSTYSLVGSLQFPLENIMSIMQGSARVFLEGGTAVIFNSCPVHWLNSTGSKGEGKAWHTQRRQWALNYVKSVSFPPVPSKPSKWKYFSSAFYLFRGRRMKVGWRSVVFCFF